MIDNYESQTTNPTRQSKADLSNRKVVKISYADKLKDVRWIKKRQKIFKRDGYKCTVCDSKKHLEAHHTFYYSTYPDPWEYPDKSLLTVCSTCHYDYHCHHETEIREPPNKKKFRAKPKKAKPKKLKKKRKLKMSLAEFQEVRGIRIKERIVK